MQSYYDFEQIISSLFSNPNHYIKDWEDLKEASQKGIIKTKIVYHLNYVKQIGNRQTRVVLLSLMNLKWLVSLGWLCWFIYSYGNWLALLILPCFLAVEVISNLFWKNLFFAGTVAVLISVITCKLLHMSSHYYTIIALYTMLAVVYKWLYNEALKQAFYMNESSFVDGINSSFIEEIYDSASKKSYRHPLMYINLKSIINERESH